MPIFKRFSRVSSGISQWWGLGAPTPQQQTVVVEGTTGVIPVVPSKYAGYEVEHFPANNAYYAKYGGQYLKTGYNTGIIESVSEMTYANRFSAQDEAWAAIDRHIEQQTKENVVVYRR